MKFQWRRSHIGRTILRGVAVLVLVVATLGADTLHDPATASSVLAQAGAQPVASAGRAGMTASKLRNSRMPEAICPTVNRQVTRTLRRGATATSASIKSARPAIVAYRSERMRAPGDAARWTHTARDGLGPDGSVQSDTYPSTEICYSDNNYQPGVWTPALRPGVTYTSPSPWWTGSEERRTPPSASRRQRSNRRLR